ncbi:lytic polysaccharide monooxygenase [Streptomyces sp. NA02950]|uniref:lytic polysaccharide monooxygenase n=1 Tax=Streptomyces sp. NA02950 TaxID=2742137 RepID=UPI001591CEAE|nr:lytic polysaccharide monooxygenase [Streptomyces sp. NA02950]QKV96595.1 lytic polysaccharide monooxygenase [Streptomyces sp. NA02950]
MTSYRTTAAAALLGAAPCLLTALAAGPAAAHGAPTDPVSRTVACSPEGGEDARSAACEAAGKVNGPDAEHWDNLRIAGVNGKDRQRIPDGKLCSAGLDAYKGLDLPRDDWPSTRLTAGKDLTLTYRSTIPHTGTFELHLTKRGYDPKQPLTWSDLEAKPFAKATDPTLEDNAYRIKAKLPADRTGRQVLYTIWRNTSTPDTYYSCSDVVLTASDDEKNPQAKQPPRDRATPGDRQTPAARAAAVGGDGGDDSTTPVLMASGAAVLVLGAGVAATVRRRRPSR